jgi:hypothetical protein
LVAPDDRRAHDVPLGIEQDRSVHLPREPHSRDAMRRRAGLPQNRACRLLTRGPPILRILFSPGCLRRAKLGVLGRGGRDEPSLLIQQKSARTASADVYAQERNDGLLLIMGGAKVVSSANRSSEGVLSATSDARAPSPASTVAAVSSR